MLPIQIPRFEPNQWRSLEKQLIAIASKEKSELNPRDRKVNNSLALIQNYASKLQWGDLFRFLLERNIVVIEAAIAEVEIPQSAIAEPPPKPKKAPNQKPKSPKQRVGRKSKRGGFLSLIPQILHSDRAIGIPTIAAKAKELGFEIGYRLVQEYLNQFAKEGLIYKTIADHKYTAYALNRTDLIDPAEWLPAKFAYRIAVKNGYKLSFHFFTNRPYTRTPSKEKITEFYAQYGIEYKFDRKPMDNQKWRVLNDNVG